VGEGLSVDASARLKWMQHYEQRGCNAARTCRHFAISRQTFSRWGRRFARDGPLGLEGRSRRMICCARTRDSLSSCPAWTIDDLKCSVCLPKAIAIP
jgi:transposase-like protein